MDGKIEGCALAGGGAALVRVELADTLTYRQVQFEGFFKPDADV